MLMHQSLVQGTVTDETGESLPGVSVVVKGTTNGTVTDVNGKYSIQATSKDILSFTYVGMAEQDIKVAGQKTINVVMKDDVASLDEVIVVGYGTAKKQSLTGAVSAVKGDELLKAPATNVSSLLMADVCRAFLLFKSLENRVMTKQYCGFVVLFTMLLIL